MAAIVLIAFGIAAIVMGASGGRPCFAQYMQVHALLATGGYTYSQMGRFEALPNTPKGELAPSGGTENEKFAAIDPETKLPVENGARQTWVTETALSTALNAGTWPTGSRSSGSSSASPCC